MSEIDSRSHDLISFYLKKRGWTRVESNRTGIDIFIEPGQPEPFEIILPKKPNVPGYSEIVSEAIRIIAESEQLEKSLVAKKIRNIDKDFHNYRISDYSEAVAFDLITRLLNCTKSMLIRASRYEYLTSYYSRLSPEDRKKANSPSDESSKFIEDCEFGHTWHGSFGVTIQVPLWLTSLGLLEEIPETLGRKTTKRTLKAYKVISDAVVKGSDAYILDHIESEDEILMFENFPEIQDTLKGGKIDIEIEMSPAIKVEEDVLQSRKARIDQKTLGYIQRAVEKVKAPADELVVELVGFPRTISATREDLLDLEQGERKVIVEGVSREIDRVSLRMELSLNDYKKAIRAQDEVRYVRVKCKVRKKFRGWEVTEVSGFELLDNS